MEENTYEPLHTLVFEIPLQKQPSAHFHGLVDEINNVFELSHAQYNRSRLTLCTIAGKKASVTPILRKVMGERRDRLETKIGIFASKFNITNACVAKNEATMVIDIVDAEQFDYWEELEFPELTVAILRVTVACNTEKVCTILKNFFDMLDSHGCH